MIIVEGPDGAGKTTLVERIEAEHGLTREPRAVSSGAEKLIPIGRYVETEIEKGFGMRLYDRFALISSPMYMSLPKRTFSEEMLDLNWLSEMHYRFKVIDPVIILCLPPIEVVEKNLFGDVDNNSHYSALNQHWDTVYWHYHNWIAQHGLNSSVMHYDYTVTGKLRDFQDNRVTQLIRYARKRIERGDA